MFAFVQVELLRSGPEVLHLRLRLLQLLAQFRTLAIGCLQLGRSLLQFRLLLSLFHVFLRPELLKVCMADMVDIILPRRCSASTLSACLPPRALASQCLKLGMTLERV